LIVVFYPYHVYLLYQVIWLKEFKTFKNKSNAFNHTGINSELAQMIKKWHLPGQLLAVGKQEHKTIIEQKLVSIVSLLCLKKTRPTVGRQPHNFVFKE